MYTAWRCERGSVQPAAARASAESTNLRRSMWFSLGVGAFGVEIRRRPALAVRTAPLACKALGEQRHHDRHVVQANQDAARLAHGLAGDAQQDRKGANESDQRRAADGARRMDQ